MVSLDRRRSEVGRERRSVRRDSSVARSVRARQRSVIETYDTDSRMSAQDDTVWTGGQTDSDRRNDSSDATMSVYQPQANNHFLNEIDFPVLVRPLKTSQPARTPPHAPGKPLPRSTRPLPLGAFLEHPRGGDEQEGGGVASHQTFNIPHSPTG